MWFGFISFYFQQKSGQVQEWITGEIVVSLQFEVDIALSNLV